MKGNLGVNIEGGLLCLTGPAVGLCDYPVPVQAVVEGVVVDVLCVDCNSGEGTHVHIGGAGMVGLFQKYCVQVAQYPSGKGVFYLCTMQVWGRHFSI